MSILACFESKKRNYQHNTQRKYQNYEKEQLLESSCKYEIQLISNE
jgi:hypothetical protein